MTPQSLSGPFSAAAVDAGGWLLRAAAADGASVYLRGVPPDATRCLEGVRIAGLRFDWQIEGVRVAVTADQGVRTFTCESVFIHEPKARLYESLPLASFDAAARRFWRRVFRVIRIPGGRWLLGVIARRRRGTASQ